MLLAGSRMCSGSEVLSAMAKPLLPEAEAKPYCLKP